MSLFTPKGAKSLRYQSKGEMVELRPVPLVAAQWESQLTPTKMKSLDLALAQEELGRMYRLFERFGAWLQPLKPLETGGVVWELRFPGQGVWKSGPRAPSAWKAMRQNYELNKRFPGYDAAGKDQYALGDINATVDRATRDTDRKLGEAQNAALDRFKAR